MKPHRYNHSAEMLQFSYEIFPRVFLVRSGFVCAKFTAYVFALTIFGKGEKFHLFLEATAQEPHESVRLTVELMNPRATPPNATNFLIYQSSVTVF